ncbi:MAG TPA: D-tyrosyl-tRNA(Tyr) deacylase [Phycisphaerales bacterium]|nr:D-tyrosyl-tRNA(Tyr) deacylase [Phycisphaerales bacterium]HCD34353.1 D-tyrosyl-tRNA(Tyr) deacylase [Phycisphaerales bacterium]|tara:strand:+ start:1785 stop:2237 length:453 start_codon:yes stop_codon:yes gene_type:complete
MRVCLQRVLTASVTVDSKVVGEIQHGLLLLTGVGHDDTADIVDKMAAKVVNLRIFSDSDGKFNLSLLDTKGGALVVSQFTLYADAHKGRRPSYIDAARPETASPLCDRFAQQLEQLGIAPVQTGIFGADMDVALVNDGPVTIWLDSDDVL